MFRLITVLIWFGLLLSCTASDQINVDEPVSGEMGSAEYGIVPWIMACRVPGQGFGCFPGDVSFVTRTGMALEALQLLGRLDEIKDRQALIAWLKSKQNVDGGYREADDFYHGKSLPWGTDSALEPTYWALKTLRLLGGDPDDPERTAKFIRDRQLPEGAFDSYELGWNETRTKAMSYSTFWAVAALKELGEPVPETEKVIAFLRQLQSPPGGSGGFRLGDLQFTVFNAQACFYATSALSLLGMAPERPAEVRSFLFSSHGQEPDGGFECGHGDAWNNYDHDSRMVDTYAAVKTLEMLGQPLSDENTSRATSPLLDCIHWITSLQNPDGGFARFGVTEMTPLPSPSEMAPTWQAVSTLSLLNAEFPSPADPIIPEDEVQPHVPKYLYPSIRNEDPVDVWAYRRIALPIHEYFFERTGSHIETIGYLSKWARKAVSPVNAAFGTGGRSLLMHGLGQCGQMSLMLQQLAASVDYPARYSFTFGCFGGDVNCEIRVQEKDWDRPHWCLFIPFANEYIDPTIATPEGKTNGWSALDCAIDLSLRKTALNYPSRTKVGDHIFETIRIEMVDYETGQWGEELRMDLSTTYDSEVARKLYPGESW